MINPVESNKKNINQSTYSSSPNTKSIILKNMINLFQAKSIKPQNSQ